MTELRAKDVAVGDGETLVELRCPEHECGHLLIRFRQAQGSSIVETFCRKCGTKAVWRLEMGRRPVYKVTERRV